MSEDGPGATLGDALAELATLPDIGDLVRDHVPPADPGREVVDLPDDLALTTRYSWAAAEAAVRPPGRSLTRTLDVVTARLSSDYVYVTWLADVLRGAGLVVVEHPGWKTRGRPLSVGPFTPRGLCWHHDASPRGPSPSVGRFLAEIGRPAEGIPAPLAQTWVCMGCDGAHPVGTWHVLAAGRANHAGEGVGWGAVRPDTGNTALIGVETDNTSGEPTPKAMFASLVVGSAAIMRRLRSDPRQWLTGHKEYARGRKIDPDDVDMDRGRRLVVRLMRDQADGRKHRRPRDGGPRPPVELVDYPGRQHFQLDRRCTHGAVESLRGWLGLSLDDRGGDVYDAQLQGRVVTMQQNYRVLRDELDAHPGYPGPETWWQAQIIARDRARAP